MDGAIWFFIGIFVGIGLYVIHDYIAFRKELRMLEYTLKMNGTEKKINIYDL